MCFGLGEWEVKKGKAGDGGLNAVGQSSGTAVPREPRTQIAEELHTGTTTTTVTTLNSRHIAAAHNQPFCYFGSALFTVEVLTVHVAVSRLSKVRRRKKNFTSANAARSA